MPCGDESAAERFQYEGNLRREDTKPPFSSQRAPNRVVRKALRVRSNPVCHRLSAWTARMSAVSPALPSTPEPGSPALARFSFS